MNEWSQEKEQKILKRSKWFLTLKIIRILALIVFGYIIYMMALYMLNESFDSSYEDAYFMRVTTSMKYPNLTMEGGFLEDKSINAFGTRTFSAHLMKSIGLEEKLVGQIKAEKRIMNVNSKIHYDLPQKDQLNKFSFTMPSDETAKQTAMGDKSNTIWKQLEMLPEGTVAEMKITTTEYMTPQQLLEKLEDYDLHVLWMPLFTGEFESFIPTAYGGSGQWVTLTDRIGLYGGQSSSDDFRSSFSMGRLSLESIEESKQMLLTNMAEMIDKGTTYHESFLGLSYLEERYNWLQTNGFQVYGAVVTGPTKELLKLREEIGIHEVQLGEVEFWNWE